MRRTDPVLLTVLTFITVLGAGIRLSIVIPSDFPLNDGGLFYVMIADLAAHHLGLPIFTTYNAASIPFAYPPLALYVYAAIHLVSHIPVIGLMQYGPAIVSAACIPAFYFLAAEVLRSPTEAALATLVFALIPRSFDWLIMGGGVTRSLGLLFALLAMRQGYRLFESRERQAILPAIVFGSLTAYSHPEAATQLAISLLVFYLWKDRTRAGLFGGLMVAAGIMILTSPWWATILARYGIDPFVSVAAAARADSFGPMAALVTFFRLDFADEPFIALLTLLGLVGLAFELSRRRYMLPTWMLAMYLLEPRGAPTFMMVPLSMSAGIALARIILPALTPTTGQEGVGSPDSGSNWLDRLLAPRSTRWVLGSLLIYGAVSAYAVGWRVRQDLTLTGSDLEALKWVQGNTGLESRLAVVTQELPLRDSTSEWFPALTGRQSVATVFGYEWLKNADFARIIQRYQALQACAQRDVECLRNWSMEYDSNFDYVYVRNEGDVSGVALTTFLDESSDFQAVFRSQTVAIYASK